ncbi:uncharacterized protein LOC128349340 [Hemicordylus capensis]|uniref:uncharacterized protein LOC128349340 n=1 Tax=Hemicordylus capensis TaxID=884348 RepID=UPI002303449F|nr:uncharacterized protein LOC128349340 [Hemicordylus capensis]XP_053161404.1 uncharacterized protein LOC128349340 [Hemicordylus capensis]
MPACPAGLVYSPSQFQGLLGCLKRRQNQNQLHDSRFWEHPGNRSGRAVRWPVQTQGRWLRARDQWPLMIRLSTTPRGRCPCPWAITCCSPPRKRYGGMNSLICSYYCSGKQNPERGKGDLRDKERIRYKTVDRNWSNWLVGYMVYMGVMLQKQPVWGASMVKYLDIIYHAFLEYSGPAWAPYNEAFRRYSAMNPELPWDCHHQQLWMRIMGPNRPGGGEFSDCGHLIVKSAATPAKGQMPGASGQFRQPCWGFASAGTCLCHPCRFWHACTICRGPHSFNSCPKGHWPRTGHRDGPAAKKGGSPTPVALEKGPSPIRLGPLSVAASAAVPGSAG